MYKKVYRLFLGDTTRGRHLLFGIALCMNSTRHSTKHFTPSIRLSTTGWTFQNFSHAKRARRFQAHNASCAASCETSRAANFEIQIKGRSPLESAAHCSVISCHAMLCHALLRYITLLCCAKPSHTPRRRMLRTAFQCSAHWESDYYRRWKKKEQLLGVTPHSLTNVCIPGKLSITIS